MVVLGFGGRSVEALRLEHTVDVDTRTGAATLRVPLVVPRGRAGFAPSLELAYSSGAGNSPYGVGWSLGGLPPIAVSTRLHVPRWDGDDRFAFGGDDLVPWLDASNAPRGFVANGWSVAFLRSRRGSGTTRVEKWVEVATGRVHFRTRDPHGVLTIYGARPNAAARIADPSDETRTFVWLPELQIDPVGNAIWLDYAAETLDGVDLTAPFERRRPSLAQRYLQRISYGNTTPLALDDATLAGTQPRGTTWCFQVVFDFGDHSDPRLPAATPDAPWAVRRDPMSSFSAGFEVRTYRLCRRVLSFHQFTELGPTPALVGMLALAHDEEPAGSTLTSLTYTGVRHDAGNATSAALPPLQLTYAAPSSAIGFSPTPRRTADNAPGGLSGKTAFVDLRGEGLAGLLWEDSRAWYYKPNRGRGEFGEQCLVLERPAASPTRFQLGDIDHDGDPDFAELAGRLAGLYEFDRESRVWQRWRPFVEFPHVEALGPRAHWIDLNGDGRADVLIARDDAFVWYASDGDHFRPPVEIPHPAGARAPSAGAAAATHDFMFADMTGDGLADLVRVQDGRIEYWPSLGNGRFGDVVVMDGAPTLGDGGLIDPTRVRFTDLDGSGTSDLIYLDDGVVRCWFNACGNQLLPGPTIDALPALDNASSIQILDFLGDGRQCLVWSSPLPGQASPLEYLPLTPEVPPRRLLAVDDSLGRQTQLTYASSATHYLHDLESGRDWTTRLPSHVEVVDQIETLDQIASTHVIRRYEYHDGYYDGVEREHRGFAHVDMFDAEVDDDSAAYAPASLTRTWFHVGVELPQTGTFTGDAQLPRLSPEALDGTAALRADEIEDGLRALVGSVIRREVYAVTDAGVVSDVPFLVEQSSFRLRCLQPATARDRAAFSASSREHVTWTYEQAAADPRVAHQIVLATDAYDRPTRTATIGYARRAGTPVDVDSQANTLVRVDDQAWIDVDTDDRYEIGVASNDESCELVGVTPSSSTLFTFGQLNAAAVSAALASPITHDLPLPDPATSPAARQFAAHSVYYWNDARTAALALGQVGAVTLVHHDEHACFSATFATTTLNGKGIATAQLIAANYAQDGALWWQAAPTIEYAPASQFSLPSGTVRSDNATTSCTYDAYAICATQTVDALGNTTTAAIDYCELAPWQLTDPNGNVVEVRYDALGAIVLSTRYGHAGSQPWGFAALASATAAPPPTIADALANPAQYLQSAAELLYYELATPTVALRLAAEQLLHDGAGGGTSSGRIHTELEYYDGLGRTLQKKALVEAGPAIQRDANGEVIVDAGGAPVLANAATRWRTSGHVTYDRKNQPVARYQPFFSPSSAYEGDAVLETLGVATLILRDAIGRSAHETYPNGTFATTQYAAWSTVRADANDNVAGSAYAALRAGLAADDPERQAYQEALPHAGTTISAFVDPLGRTAGTLAHGGTTAVDRRSITTLDIAGNAVQVTDARGLVALAYQRDMRGLAFATQSMDAGATWSLPDAYGRTIETWDGCNFQAIHGYDLGDRPLYIDVTGGDGATPLDARVAQWAYGESLANRADAAQRNLLGRVATTSDSGGQIAVDHYDPPGRALAATRSLRTVVDSEPDWRATVPLEAETYASSTLFDALGRPTSETLQDGTLRATQYLASGQRASVAITTPDGTLTNTPILASATYDARGSRIALGLGNGVQVAYSYDAQTFRLATQNAALGSRALQTLSYTYDPVGNLVRLVDAAQQGASPIIAGATASARRDYTYDAHYQLLTASGRVHQALLQNDYIPGSAGTFMATRQLTLNDGTAVVPFTQLYTYDAAGNLESLQHTGTTQSWTTAMWISPTSNRALPSLDPNGNPISNPATMFDARGNIMQLSHLRELAWSYRGELARAVVIARPGGTDDAETYVYDAVGQRLRRTTTRVVSGGQIQITEKVYFGGSERKRITLAGTLILERWTTHVRGDDDRIALVHRWTIDTLAREVDSTTQPHVHYELNTHQGSAALELDASGNIISYEEYFPYGGTTFIAGDDLREVSLKDYRYSGKECDDFTSLYYYGYRYYAPWMARWLSADPSGPADGLNLYAFVRGNPTTMVDASGLATAWEAAEDSDPELHLEYRGLDRRSDYHGLKEYGPSNPDESAVVQFPADSISASKHGSKSHPKPQLKPQSPKAVGGGGGSAPSAVFLGRGHAPAPALPSPDATSTTTTTPPATGFNLNDEFAKQFRERSETIGPEVRAPVEAPTAGEQIASGVGSAVGNIAKGAAIGAAEWAFTFGMYPLYKAGKQVGDTTVKTALENKRTKGTFDLNDAAATGVNSVNPVFGILKAGVDSKSAYDKGDLRGAAYNATTAVVQTAATAAMVTGAAGGIAEGLDGATVESLATDTGAATEASTQQASIDRLEAQADFPKPDGQVPIEQQAAQGASQSTPPNATPPVADTPPAGDTPLDDDPSIIKGSINRALKTRMYRRPSSFSESFDQTVFKNAKGADGVVRDPGHHGEISYESDWQRGHIPEYESWKGRRFAEVRGLTEREWRQMQRDPKYYRPETPKTNQGHKFEDPSGTNNGYFKDRWAQGEREYQELLRKQRGQ